MPPPPLIRRGANSSRLRRWRPLFPAIKKKLESAKPTTDRYYLFCFYPIHSLQHSNSCDQSTNHETEVVHCSPSLVRVRLTSFLHSKGTSWYVPSSSDSLLLLKLAWYDSASHAFVSGQRTRVGEVNEPNRPTIIGQHFEKIATGR